MSRIVIPLIALMMICGFAEAQTRTKTVVPVSGGAKPARPEISADTVKSSKSPDYTSEPFVIEKFRKVMRFEDDGAGQIETTGEIRVQSEAGVQALGQLVWGYNSGNQRLDIHYVRVRRADGSVISASSDAVQDLTSPISREAPMYTDYRQKHVTVPGLRPGEKLEYQYVVVTHTAFAPGQFWAEHDFIKDAIVLSEELEINVPRPRVIKLKTAKGVDPAVTDEGGRRIYRWTSANLTRDTDDKPGKKKQKKSNEPEPPAVQLTTFANWEEIGRWYASLERERRAATPELRAKAAALIAGRNTDREKVEALYDFVAGNYRYVSLSFGVGRYQPHAAAEVLANEYGDCKDKHTLLAALLEASGFQADTVLIHTTRKLDESLPSPAQFDHVITLAHMAKDSVWLDTTTEVAPFGMLVMPLRDKQALVLARDGSASISRTLANLPFESFNRIEMTGQVSEVGKLTRHSREEYRGDNELLIRSVLRRVPEPRWKSIAEWVELQDGRTSEITGFKAANLNVRREPLVLEYDAVTANFLDWSSKKVQLKVPAGQVEVPDNVDEDDDINPIKLGAPGSSTWTLHLDLPAKYTIRLPLPVAVKRDYAEYKSEYRLEGKTVLVTRSLLVLKSELPPERRADCRAFWRLVRNDVSQRLDLETKADASALPESADAEELENAADAAREARNYEGAITLYKGVVSLEPKHKSAWNNMGRAQLDSGQLNEAIASFNKAIEINPYEEYAYNNLGLALWRQQKHEEAAASFHKQIEINPLDSYAHRNLGLLSLEQKKYAEALPELEKALTINPNDLYLKVAIGQAELNLGQDDKAVASFDEVVGAMPTPLVWNNIAYELSLKKIHLDRAQRYAETAVSTTIATLRNLDLDGDETQQQLQENLTASLAAYWDTLGWVYFQRGDLDQAEKYIRPSWEMSQEAEVGGHLAQIYEQRGDKDKALDQYARALAGGRQQPDLRKRFAALLGSESKVDSEVNKRRPFLSEERTLKLGKLLSEDASAEFTLVFVSGPAAESARFLKGSEKLKTFADLLKAKTYKIPLPGDSPVRLVRRGILSCSKQVGECSFVLMTPAGPGRPADTRSQPIPTSSSNAR